MKVSTSVTIPKVSTTIRLKPSLLEKLKALAEKDGRSFNNFVERCLEQA